MAVIAIAITVMCIHFRQPSNERKTKSGAAMRPALFIDLTDVRLMPGSLVLWMIINQ